MATIIGYSTLHSLPAALNRTSPKLLGGTGIEAVLPAGQKITEVHVGWEDGNGTTASTIEVALYDIGAAGSNKPMIAGSKITIPYDPTTLSAGPQWLSITGLNIDISADAGKTLAVGIAPPDIQSSSGFNILYSTSISGSTRQNHSSTTSVLPDPLIAGTASQQSWSLYFVTEDIVTGPTPTIDSVEDPITIGAVSHTVSGFGSTVNSGKLISGLAEIPLNSVTGTGSVIPSIVNGNNAVLFGPVTYQLTDGTDIASISTDLTIPTGYNLVTLTSVSGTGISYIFNSWTGTPEIGGQIIWSSTNLVMHEDGSFESTADGTYTFYYISPSEAQPIYESGSLIIGELPIVGDTVLSNSLVISDIISPL